jgi:nitrogen fixation protein NifU and related proteins
MVRYNKEVLCHFMNPKNGGTIEDADGVGELGNPECSNFLKLNIKVERDRLADVEYQIRGCPAVMAVASAPSELAISNTVEDGPFTTDDDVVEALRGLPEIKLHCSNVGASALQPALKGYYERRMSRR